jgi:hypothetical protein
MFSQNQKQQIASGVEQLLLSLHHPEMPNSKPSFALHVDGKDKSSWADIKPNWMFAETPPATNPHNEAVAERMKDKTYIGDQVYVTYDGYHVILTTENGIATTNQIYLEPQVLEDFLQFVNQLKK